MSKNHIKLLFCLSLIGLMPSVAYPMAAATPVAGKAAMELLKKGIEKGTTALHWSIAAGTSWATSAGLLAAYFSFENDIIQRKKEVGENKLMSDWENWIRKELKNQGMEEADSLTLVPNLQEEMHFGAGSYWNKKRFNYSMPVFMSSWDTIQLSNGFDNTVDELLNQGNEKAPLSGNEVRAILSHEKTHIEKNHTERLFLCGLALPFFTHFLGKKIFNGPKTPVKPMSILNAYAQFGINTTILWYISHFDEKEADEGVVNDVEILDGAARFCRRTAELKENTLQKLNIDKKLLEVICFVAHLFDPHSDSLKRAQRFEERATQLRAHEYEKGLLKRMALKEAQFKAAEHKI